MSLTKFKIPSLRDKQEAKNMVEDPRMEILSEKMEEKKVVKKKTK